MEGAIKARVTVSKWSCDIYRITLTKNFNSLICEHRKWKNKLKGRGFGLRLCSRNWCYPNSHVYYSQNQSSYDAFADHFYSGICEHPCMTYVALNMCLFISEHHRTEVWSTSS